MLAEGARLAGQAELGGVWEWTSSALEKHQGFEPMALYPGYTGMTEAGLHLAAAAYGISSIHGTLRG